jgi:hypothetical protein
MILALRNMLLLGSVNSVKKGMLIISRLIQIPSSAPVSFRG